MFEKVPMGMVGSVSWENVDRQVRDKILKQFDLGSNQGAVFYRKEDVFLRLDGFDRSIPEAAGVEFGDFQLVLGSWLGIVQFYEGYLLFPQQGMFGFIYSGGSFGSLRRELIKRGNTSECIYDSGKRILYFVDQLVGENTGIIKRKAPLVLLKIEKNEVLLVDKKERIYSTKMKSNFKIDPIVGCWFGLDK